MKRTTLLLLAALLSLPAWAGNGSDPIRLISYNLRNSGADDGPNHWSRRSHATTRMLSSERPDLFGVQEALADQLSFLDSICPDYGRIGVGRDDGISEGETMAIYYNRTRFDLLDSGTLWLSETPDKVSCGWDGACNRTMTWVELRDKRTGKVFFYFNTHLDHQGSAAREEGIKLIVSKIREIAGKSPAVLGGDFNSSTDSPIFKPLTSYMKSARDTAPTTDRKGTFNSFGSAPDTIMIDHFFYRGRLRCQRFATLTENYGAPYISDHYPILMDFTL